MKEYILRICSLIFLSAILGHCQTTSKKEGMNNMCSDFFELNKNQSFDDFKSISIDSRNVEFDSETEKYMVEYSTVSFYDSVGKEYIKIPLYNENSDDLSDLSVKCGSNCEEYLKANYSYEEFDLDTALRSIKEKLNSSLDKIRIPKDHPYNRVVSIVGKPFNGTIEFKLSNDQKLIFVWDQTKVKSRIDGKSLGDGWYCLKN